LSGIGQKVTSANPCEPDRHAALGEDIAPRPADVGFAGRERVAGPFGSLQSRHPRIAVIAACNVIRVNSTVLSDQEAAATDLTAPMQGGYVDSLVSIVTPAYRAARFIGETIRSVQAQTYRDFEMLIVDDCSPDDTAAVVERVAAGDSRIRLLRQSTNSGPAAARNRALAESRGRWIAFLDSDDLWLPRKLERQLEFHRAQGAKISFTEFRRVDAEGSRLGRLITVRDWLDYGRLLCDTGMATSTVIVDRARTGPFSMKKTYYDDYACWLELLRSGGRAVGLHEDLMRYRVVGGSVSRNKLKSARHVWRTYREVERLGLLRSAWSFVNYAGRGVSKYWRF
jgi:teichuronic acid biosynthesis glycosyltransferase TuaG